MTETNLKQCRICLATDDKVPVSDASCYIEFFIQVLPLKTLNEKFLLCIWCKSAMKKALAIITMLLESEKNIHDKNSTAVSSKHNSLYNFNIVHNPHIDIPSFNIEDKNITEEIDHTTLPEIVNEIKNEDLINTEETLTKGERKNRKEFEFKELNFEVEYLNLEQQMEEIELKKLKYKEFEFQCDLCGIGCLTSDVFDEHRIRHSEVAGPNKCSICSLHFKSQDVLSQHMLAHKRRFKCMLCNHVFKRWSHCTGHRYKCGGTIQPVACEVCGKIFSNEHSLKIHMKVHKTEKKYCCDQCDRKFATKQRLTVHMRSHSGVLPFSCAQCARSFATKCNLRAHASVHEMCTLHYCVECHTHYSTANSLKRSHSGVLPFSCAQCARSFATKCNLRAHASVHEMCTQHYCVECHTRYKTNKSLKRHFKGSHSGVLPFSCAQCARSFATKCNLRAHASVHEMCTQHYCVECHTHYKTNKSLKRHFKESVKHAVGNDMYSCKECTKKFSNETSLRNHVNTRHGTEYRCTHCDKTFSNNSNLNKHIKCIHSK